MFALDEALNQLESEGIGEVYERHAAIGQFTRDGVRSLGLELFAKDERYASNTVTAVTVPDGVDAGRLVGKMRMEHGVVLSGGQASLAGKIFPHRTYGQDERGGHSGGGGRAAGGFGVGGRIEKRGARSERERALWLKFA